MNIILPSVEIGRNIVLCILPVDKKQIGKYLYVIEYKLSIIALGVLGISSDLKCIFPTSLMQ